MIHTDFRKGIRLFIILRCGGYIVDRFVESKGGRIITDNHSIEINKIRSATIKR